MAYNGSQNGSLKPQQIPEHQMAKIFKQLQFLFLPNSKTNILKVRKQLAEKNGAKIVEEYNDSVSHIIIDTYLLKTKQNFINLLGGNEIYKHLRPTTKIVDQNWLVDSLAARKLQDEADYIPELHESPTKITSRNVSPRKESSSKSETLQDVVNDVEIENNPNREVIDVLKQMGEHRKIQGEVFRAQAYHNAILSLSRSNQVISTAAEAEKLPGIGKSIALKIQEIAQNHKLKDLQILQMNEEQKAVQQFMQINGVGPVTARQWFNEGFRTIEDILKVQEKLSLGQRLGLQYFSDWNSKIPREEVQAHEEYLNEMIQMIDAKVNLTIGGSYRRGAKVSGDIDVMVTKENSTGDELRVIMIRFAELLTKSGYLRCKLNNRISNKLYCGCSLPPDFNYKVTSKKEWGFNRRIDFLLVPWSERGAAYIYFTGNDNFNKLIRLKAARKGMRLNDSGLFLKVNFRNKNFTKPKLLLLSDGSNERKIFKLLGVKWKDPVNRNLGDAEPLELDLSDMHETKEK